MNTKTEQILQPTPSRAPPVPQAQPTQTNFGFLEHTGQPDILEPIQDIPFSIDWMMAMPYLIDLFTVSSTNIEGDVLASWNGITDIEASSASAYLPWASIGFTTSTYWTGYPSYRLLAIKPSRTPMKLIVVFEYKNLDSAPPH